MKRGILVFLSLTFLMAGCAFFGHLKEDYVVGRDTPYAEGEKTIDDQTGALVNTASGIPYVNLAAPFLVFLAPPILRVLRGHRIRKRAELPPKPSPVEHASDLVDRMRQWVFDVGPDHSFIKRTWKVAVLAFAAQAAAPYVGSLVPFVQGHYPGWLPDAGLAALVGILAGLEKKLSAFGQVAASGPGADATAISA